MLKATGPVGPDLLATGVSSTPTGNLHPASKMCQGRRQPWVTIVAVLLAVLGSNVWELAVALSSRSWLWNRNPT